MPKQRILLPRHGVRRLRPFRRGLGGQLCQIPTLAEAVASGERLGHCKFILPPARSCEPAYPIVVGHKRAAETYGAGDKQTICRIAVFQMVQAICMGCCHMIELHGFESRSIQEALHPRVHRQVEFDEALVHEHRDLPYADRTEENSATGLPCRVNRPPGCLTQTGFAAIQPQDDMRIEQQIRHRRISRPISASIASSRIGWVRSTPRRTRTEPGLAPNNDCPRAVSSSSRRTAVATSSVLLPPVIWSAAFSIRATTSGRLIVTTLATAGVPCNDLHNDIMIGEMEVKGDHNRVASSISSCAAISRSSSSAVPSSTRSLPISSSTGTASGEMRSSRR